MSIDKNIDSLSPIYRLLDGVAFRLPTRRLSNDDLIRALREKQLKDDAVNNCLPNELTLYEISLLVADDDRVWCRDFLNDAILAGELKAIIDDSNNKITINKVELKKYIDTNGFDFSDFPLLNNWFNESDNQADIEQTSAAKNQDDNKPKGEATSKDRRNNQINLICNFAKQFNYELLSIPEGGKAKIKSECLKNSLFTDSGFNHAWKEANKRNLISMKDKDKYL